MGRYHVPAVERALQIIELLANAQSPQRLTDLSADLRIPKTTALMILTTLEEGGYVVKTEHGQYQLTTKIIELGSKQASLKEVAREHLQQLAEEVKLTVHLSGFVDGQNVVIDKVNGPGFIQFSTYDGKRQSFHATSSGKAMLAFMPEDELSHILSTDRLERYTPSTIVTHEQLLEELRTIRINGYAVDDEEEEMGVRCIGAPVFNAVGKVVSAVSVTGVLSELNLKSIHAIAKRVKTTADAISRILGAK